MPDAVLYNAKSADQISLIYPYTSSYLSLTKNWHNFGADRDGGKRKHAGVDISAPSGTPFVAVADGTVKAIFDNSARGWCLILSHGGGVLYSLYEHMEQSHGNYVGKTVKQGEVIGYTGNRGDSSGPHLHFGLFTKYYTDNGSDTQGMKTSPRTTLDPDLYISEENAHESTTYVAGTSESYASSLGTSAQPSVYNDEGNTNLSEQHTTETIRAWTRYLDDNKRKSTDEYKLVWKGYGQEAYDISGRVVELSLKDSIDSFCLELSFTIVRSEIDYYLRRLDDFAVGDQVSLTNVNSGEMIFVGTVQQTSGNYGESISVVCLDEGMFLTKNEFLVQFHSCTAYDAVATMASKCGLKKIQCPKFTSTCEQTYEKSASEIIKDVLEQVKTENGITYFCRVFGNAIVVRSRAKDYITPYYKPSDNVEAIPCVAARTKVSLSQSTANTYNSVQVYQSEDSAKEVVAELQDDESIARFGRWNKLVEYSGKDPSTAPKKAEYELNYVYDLIEKTISFSCPGSDRFVAGIRIQVPVGEELVECWVQSVSHTYYPNHTVSLDLKICDNEEPVYEGPDVEESTDDSVDSEDGTSYSVSQGEFGFDTTDNIFNYNLDELRDLAVKEYETYKDGSDPTTWQ